MKLKIKIFKYIPLYTVYVYIIYVEIKLQHSYREKKRDRRFLLKLEQKAVEEADEANDIFSHFKIPWLSAASFNVVIKRVIKMFPIDKRLKV